MLEPNDRLCMELLLHLYLKGRPYCEKEVTANSVNFQTTIASISVFAKKCNFYRIDQNSMSKLHFILKNIFSSFI